MIEKSMDLVTGHVDPGHVDPEHFRAMMRGFPSGVVVVTALDGLDRPRGMTCSSVCSVTLVPPTLLVSLRAGSPTLAAALGRRRFTVNLLHDGAQDVAELFASGDPRRFDRVDWGLPTEAAGPHLRPAAHAVADCRVGRTVPVGDHVVVLGQVSQVFLRTDLNPLVYGHRRYGGWPPHAGQR